MLTRYRRHSHLPSLTVLTGDGIKTLDLSATTAEAWRLLFGGEQTPDDIERLYHAVGPLYTAVMARAQAIAGLPWRLRTARGAARPLDIDALSDLLVAAEIDYVLHGAAYWLRDPTAPLGLRRLHPRTMVVET
ncbi:MAG: phage portal protein, partial [Burkholderiaceae bacterium]|nr:phage portal protein [Burkholderiaceae bacterium]